MPSPRADQAGAQVHGAGNRWERRAQAWLHARARLMPNLLNQSPPWVLDVFQHAWAPMEALAQQVRYLPPALWDYLLSCDGGFVAICSGESHYNPGPATIRRRNVVNVAFVSVADLAKDNERALHVLGHLIDHYLGCGGEAGAPWLSEGGGTRPRWRQASQHLARLFALGYSVDEAAQSDIRNYFAQSLALYCRDRQRLNVADPPIYKWFHSTLWDDSFWQA